MKEETLVLCMHCKIEQPITRFRAYSDSPLRIYDFCTTCDEAYGMLVLYENHKRETTPDVARHVAKVYAADPRYATTKGQNLMAGAAERQPAVEARHASAAEKVLQQRELMRRSLVYFTKQFVPAYKAGWVHQDICRRLEKFKDAVERGESPRLLLCMPPRHGKSELASTRFPAWLIGHHPEWEIIHACNSISLTEEFSRKIKDCVTSPEFAKVFDKLRLRKDTQNLQRWLTDRGGGYLAAGVGTGILGKGAHVLIIDDPVKDAEAADSEAQRQSVMDWYTGVAASRLAPGGGVVIIMQRWHDLDLAGRLLKLQKELEEAGVDADVIEKWEIVEYQMEADQDEYLFPDGTIHAGPEAIPKKSRLLRRKGEPLHPERYNDREMNRIKHRLLRTNPRHWHALYQQKPVPDDGEFFRSDMFRYYPSVPDWTDMRILSAWDLAIGTKQSNDWTVGIVAGVDYENNIHVLDMIRGKMGTLQIVEAMVSVMKRYSPFAFGIEHGQLSLSIMGPLRAAMAAQTPPLYTMIDETLKPITDKQGRATPLQGRMQAGTVYFPSNQPWVEKLRAEFLRFPNGENDDIVDAMAWLARMAQNVPVPQRPVLTRPKSWRDDLGKYIKGNHKSHMSA